MKESSVSFPHFRASASRGDLNLVVGGGLAGLAAAYLLAEQKKNVLLVESASAPGGQAQPVELGPVWLDLGQKQFYNRIAPVHAFLIRVLGEKGFHPYPCRTGVVYGRRILERDRHIAGRKRGLPAITFGLAALDIVYHRIKSLFQTPRNLQEQAYARQGKLLSRIFSQGFDEKLKGRKWKDAAPLPAELQSAARYATQPVWWHPHGGCAALINRLVEGILQHGGNICLRAAVTRMHAGSAGTISEAEITYNGQTHLLQTSQVLSCLPLPVLSEMLGIPRADNRPAIRRGVVAVYLLVEEPPRFPHTCLWVNTPGLKLGRITNFSAYNCGMSPEGQTVLCLEYFCLSDDPLWRADEQEILSLALEETRDMRIFDLHKTKLHKIVRQPSGDPGAGWRDYLEKPELRAAWDAIAGIPNLYEMGRPGMDRSIHAGLMAAEAVCTGNRAKFLSQTCPYEAMPWEKPELVL